MKIRSSRQLGAAIRGTRIALSLPAQDLADLMGASHAFLSRLEQGKATAAIKKLFIALNELGIELELNLPPQASSVRIEEDPNAPVKRMRAKP